MPWFKVDDTFAMHDKTMAAGNAAVGLWVRAGSWSMQQLTDGFVPNHVLRALGTARERRRLVEVSLWTEVTGGIKFHAWVERQPTRDQVETARQSAADRQRHARERAKSQRESRRDRGVSHGPPDPTRPDPPSSKEEGVVVDPPKPKTRATTRPEGFAPTQGHHALAIERGVDLMAEYRRFCDWCDANGKTYKDWNAGLRTWLNRAQPERQQRQTRQQETDSLFERAAARMGVTDDPRGDPENLQVRQSLPSPAGH